jgi:enolase
MNVLKDRMNVKAVLIGFARLVLTIGIHNCSGETEDTFIADLAVGLATVMLPVILASFRHFHLCSA